MKWLLKGICGTILMIGTFSASSNVSAVEPEELEQILLRLSVIEKVLTDLHPELMKETIVFVTEVRRQAALANQIEGVKIHSDGIRTMIENQEDRARDELARVIHYLCRKHGLPLPRIDIDFTI